MSRIHNTKNIMTIMLVHLRKLHILYLGYAVHIAHVAEYRGRTGVRGGGTYLEDKGSVNPLV
jgi:hypothetical protein